MRKLRRLTLDPTAFLKDYNEAVESGLTVREFCDLTGMNIGTLHGRLYCLAQRGVPLRPLKGMKRRTKLGRMLGVYPTPQSPPADPPVEEVVPVEPAAPVVAVPLSFEICIGTGF